MASKRCEARLARGKKADGVSVLTFEPVPGQAKPALFFVPYRCEQEVRGEGGLCVNCFTREEKTRANLEKARKPDGTLKYVVNQETLLHARVTEPIPLWSHMYKSSWFEQFRAANSLRLSEATLRRAEEAWEAAHKGVVVPSPSEQRDMPRAKKVVATVVTATAVPTVAPLVAAPLVAAPLMTAPLVTASLTAAQPEPVPPEPKPTAPRKPKKTVAARVAPVAPEPPTPPLPTTLVKSVRQPKNPRAPKSVPPLTSTAPSTVPIGLVRGPIRDAIEVVKVLVKRIELDGRTYYLDPKKDKVYDTKYNYIGRYKAREETIDTSYPDSDLE